jgi:hypothetical protein
MAVRYFSELQAVSSPPHSQSILNCQLYFCAKGYVQQALFARQLRKTQFVEKLYAPDACLKPQQIDK